ncbi:hypothetical protein ACQPZF_22730 [Actinosynnema sp. CS-041913]|uniref:hypothetical protein n=1 Tax=Actinosynnema sp. CS-041913 TaxID=3239917 RepID=UPI003D8F24E5
MADERVRSEQQEELERTSALRAERAGEGADDVPAAQFTSPGGGGAPGDEEPAEVAEDAGSDYLAGPEAQAVRIEEGDEGSGRVGE